jgi:hypothetical protein
VADGEFFTSREGLGGIPTKPFKIRRTTKRICVFDTETDPFAERRVVEPFSVGFYDGTDYVDFWGEDCIDQFFAYLAENYEPGSLIIYAHNFGRFDAYFQLKYLDPDQAPFIMGGAIVSALFQGQEFRDSWRIIPAPLKSYAKDEIDYSKLERGVREKHKREILNYQKSDCLYLYDLVSAFHERYGDRLTIGSTSLPMLNSFHGFRLMTEDMDKLIRPYYYGGRTQCFEVGVFEGDFKIYDVNSMYPHVMRNYQHPIGNIYTVGKHLNKNTAFVCVEGWSGGAFPVRQDDGGLDFPRGFGRYWISVHEYRAALETGSFTTQRIIHVRDCHEWGNFADYVDHYYKEKAEAKQAGDKVTELFTKFFLNSPYGKFAQNPEKYESYEIREFLNPPDIHDLRQECENEECIAANHNKPDCGLKGWYKHTSNGDLAIWARKSVNAWRSYKNVGIAASITGGARAELLRGIEMATRPMYCDTDSLICEGFSGPVHPTDLGAWDLEATGEVVAIAGKKMYCVLTHDLEYDPKKGEPEWCLYKGRKMRVVKKASKGVRLSAQEILEVANGGTILYRNPVPKFNLDGTADFIDREITRTA